MERLHDRVEEFSVGIGDVESRPDFVVDSGDDFGAQQPFEDHRPISLDGGVDGFGLRCRRVNMLDPGCGGHGYTYPSLEMFRR